MTLTAWLQVCRACSRHPNIGNPYTFCWWTFYVSQRKTKRATFNTNLPIYPDYSRVFAERDFNHKYEGKLLQFQVWKFTSSVIWQTYLPYGHFQIPRRGESSQTLWVLQLTLTLILTLCIFIFPSNYFHMHNLLFHQIHPHPIRSGKEEDNTHAWLLTEHCRGLLESGTLILLVASCILHVCGVARAW